MSEHAERARRPHWSAVPPSWPDVVEAAGAPFGLGERSEQEWQ